MLIIGAILNRRSHVLSMACESDHHAVLGVRCFAITSAKEPGNFLSSIYGLIFNAGL